MTQKVLRGIDQTVNILTLVVIAGGGVVFHLLTTFAIKSVYGPVWGLAAFLLPGIAEAVYATLQVIEGSPKYLILLGAFFVVTLAGAAVWYSKKCVKRLLIRTFSSELATES